MFWLTGRSNFSFWTIPHHSPTYILMFWGQNQFFPPQIQLVGRRTGAVLTRRMATYNKVVLIKVASNDTTWWHNHSKWLWRLPWPSQSQLVSSDICSYAAGVLFLHTVIDYLWRMRKIHVRVEMAEDTTAPRNVISNLNQRDKAFLEDENNCILLQKYLDSNPPYSQTLKDE